MKTYTANSLIPVLPVRNTVVFPGQAFPLIVGRLKSVAALQKSQSLQGKWIVLVAQKSDLDGKEPTWEDLHKIGTLAKIEKVRGSEKNGFQVFVKGTERFRISEFKEEGGLIQAYGEPLMDILDLDGETSKAMVKSLKELAREILSLLPVDTRDFLELINSMDDLVNLTHLCAGHLEVPISVKQELLETISIKDRSLRLLQLMQGQKENLQVTTEIREKLSNKMGKLQRDAILREQLKTIRDELGEGDSPENRENYKKRIEDALMPDEVKKVALEEMKRLEAIGNSSPEAHVIRNYLDLLCSIPWQKSSAENIDLEAARKTLDHDHYGLEKIKKRIIQYLAVMKLKSGGRGSILLFVGPPGVGKTSLGQSIAKALGRKFVRASLGGVRDDAEIRGHRRTYIGAMPGRIIQGIKRAGENNPLFMLDEIDKMGRGFQGDPASALLEVLDPEQNSNFLDQYLDVPFDLSKVFFIATANSLDSIPGPLLDRMEIIDLTGYTTAEKHHIAVNHLVPKQFAEFGLKPEQLVFKDETIQYMITHYTREAGVRDLQRQIAAVCRASTEKILAPNAQLPIVVEVKDLDEILGAEKYLHEVAERTATPGVVTGLAWTPMGGEILFVEATMMPGAGRLTITGQLGDVMKESAQIALSLARSKVQNLLPDFDYEKKDIHIHVPSGAIPKDGPSAGVAMLTTIASLFSNRPVSSKLAMTGEITLRGAVLPVGGIKEKVIAAHRAGIERIILPKRNERDLRDVPEQVRSQLKFDFVETGSEVLKIVLGIDVEAALKATEQFMLTPVGNHPPMGVA